MLRLLSDPRIALDPTRAGELPATMVWALYDSLQLANEADRLAAKGDK